MSNNNLPATGANNSRDLPQLPPSDPRHRQHSNSLSQAPDGASRDATWEGSLPTSRVLTSNSLPTPQQSFTVTIPLRADTDGPSSPSSPSRNQTNSSVDAAQPSSQSQQGSSERVHGSSGNDSSSGSRPRVGGVIGEGRPRSGPATDIHYAHHGPSVFGSTFPLASDGTPMPHQPEAESSPPASPPPLKQQLQATLTSGTDHSDSGRANSEQPPWALFVPQDSTTSEGYASVTGINPKLASVDPLQAIKQMAAMGLDVPSVAVKVGYRPPPPIYNTPLPPAPTPNSVAPRSPTSSGVTSSSQLTGSALSVRVGVSTQPTNAPPIATAITNAGSTLPPAGWSPGHHFNSPLSQPQLPSWSSDRQHHVSQPTFTQQQPQAAPPGTLPVGSTSSNSTNSHSNSNSNQNTNSSRGARGSSHPGLPGAPHGLISNPQQIAHPLSYQQRGGHPNFQNRPSPSPRAQRYPTHHSSNPVSIVYSSEGHTPTQRQYIPSTASHSFASQTPSEAFYSPSSVSHHPPSGMPQVSIGGGRLAEASPNRVLSPHGSHHSGYGSSSAGGGVVVVSLPPPPLGLENDSAPDHPSGRSSAGNNQSRVSPPAPIVADLEQIPIPRTYLPGHIRMNRNMYLIAAEREANTSSSIGTASVAASPTTSTRIAPPPQLLTDTFPTTAPAPADFDISQPTPPSAIVPSDESTNAIVFKHSNAGTGMLARPYYRPLPYRASSNPDDVRYCKDLATVSSSSSHQHVAEEDEAYHEEYEEERVTSTAAVSSESANNGGEDTAAQAYARPHVNVSELYSHQHQPAHYQRTRDYNLNVTLMGSQQQHFEVIGSLSHPVPIPDEIPKVTTDNSASDWDAASYDLRGSRNFHLHGHRHHQHHHLPPRPAASYNPRTSFPNEGHQYQAPRRGSQHSYDSTSGAHHHRFSIGSNSMLATSHQGNSLMLDQATPTRRLVNILDTEAHAQAPQFIPTGYAGMGGYVGTQQMSPLTYMARRGSGPSFAHYNADSTENSSLHQGYMNNNAPPSMDSVTPQQGTYSSSFASGPDQRQYILHTQNSFNQHLTSSNLHTTASINWSGTYVVGPAHATGGLQSRLSSATSEHTAQLSLSANRDPPYNPDFYSTLPPESSQIQVTESGPAGSMSRSYHSRSGAPATLGSLTLGPSALPMLPLEFTSQSQTPMYGHALANSASASAPDVHLMRSNAPGQQTATQALVQYHQQHVSVANREAQPQTLSAATSTPLPSNSITRRRPPAATFRNSPTIEVRPHPIIGSQLANSPTVARLEEGYFGSQSEGTTPSQERDAAANAQQSRPSPEELTAGASATSPTAQNSLSSGRTGEQKSSSEESQQLQASGDQANHFARQRPELPFYHVLQPEQVIIIPGRQSLSSGAPQGSSQTDVSAPGTSLHNTPNHKAANPHAVEYSFSASGGMTKALRSRNLPSPPRGMLAPTTPRPVVRKDPLFAESGHDPTGVDTSPSTHTTSGSHATGVSMQVNYNSNSNTSSEGQATSVTLVIATDVGGKGN